MSNQETIVVKKDLTNGNIHDSIRWYLDVANAIVGQTVEDRADKRKWPIDWPLFLVTDFWLIPHSEATTGENGSRRTDDITILNITMNAEHLSKAHQYKISDLDRDGPVNIFGLSLIHI